MNYPSLYDHYYYENANNFSEGYAFITNDLLLCIMMFLRIRYLVKIVVDISYYSDPRSQRVCNLYGADADAMFSIRATMKKTPGYILFLTLMISMVLFSYAIRLFE